MSTLRRFLIVAIVAISPAAIAGKHHRAKHHPKMSMDDAKKIALGMVPGDVKAAELEHEGGRWIYSFEIRPEGETKKIIKEVNLDSDTGEQVGKIDTERE